MESWEWSKHPNLDCKVVAESNWRQSVHCKIPDFPVALVADLIYPQDPKWRTDIINNWFLPQDATLTNRIQLKRRLPVDKLVWVHDASGEYAVKCGYYQAWYKCCNGSSGTFMSADIVPWKQLRAAPVLSRVKHLVWRLSREILSVRYR